MVFEDERRIYRYFLISVRKSGELTVSIYEISQSSIACIEK